MCTPAKHDEIKADAVKWASETYPIADAPVYGHEWSNCKDCHSTLLRPVEEGARS